MGNFAFTLGSQAFAAYRHRFMETPIFIYDHEIVRWLKAFLEREEGLELVGEASSGTGSACRDVAP